MTDNQSNNIQALITETLSEANVQGQIAQEKTSTREQIIAKLTTLLAISFKKGTNEKSRGGVKAQQK